MKFEEMNKKQKLEIVPSAEYGCKVTKAVFIPVRRKMSGYSLNAVFVQLPNGDWKRGGDYDCYSFEFHDVRNYKSLRGDFEHNGVCFFLGEFERCTYEYGTRFIIHDKKKSA